MNDLLPEEEGSENILCPACGEETEQVKCKVICRSETCIYRLVYNCSEF